MKVFVVSPLRLWGQFKPPYFLSPRFYHLSSLLTICHSLWIHSQNQDERSLKDDHSFDLALTVQRSRKMPCNIQYLQNWIVSLGHHQANTDFHPLKIKVALSGILLWMSIALKMLDNVSANCIASEIPWLLLTYIICKTISIRPKVEYLQPYLHWATRPSLSSLDRDHGHLLCGHLTDNIFIAANPFPQIQRHDLALQMFIL